MPLFDYTPVSINLPVRKKLITKIVRTVINLARGLSLYHFIVNFVTIMITHKISTFTFFREQENVV